MNEPYRFCVIIPTYRNAGTVLGVIRGALSYVEDVIVVCDGCTDDTQQLIQDAGLKIRLISYPHNKGKGYALKTGFRAAIEAGFDYAITIDSDGQHFPEDIPAFISCIEKHPGSLAVGCRNLMSENMPGGSTFANKFSNFWFFLQTGLSIPDTQSGFRAYPLSGLSQALCFLTRRYEAELELLVHFAWRDTDIQCVPVGVIYQEERVSSFRPFRDFVRISILNTVLCVLALVYGYPSKLIRRITR